MGFLQALTLFYSTPSEWNNSAQLLFIWYSVLFDTDWKSGFKNDCNSRYLCFLNVWKALSLLKLERLSVAGSNGTEWMKVETDGESWKRMKLVKLNIFRINNVNLMPQVSSLVELYTYLGCVFLLGLRQTIPEFWRERHHPLIFSQQTLGTLIQMSY